MKHPNEADLGIFSFLFFSFLFFSPSFIEMQVSLYIAALTYCRFRWLQRLFSYLTVYISFCALPATGRRLGGVYHWIFKHFSYSSCPKSRRSAFEHKVAIYFVIISVSPPLLKENLLLPTLPKRSTQYLHH
jgi:hypothetical protein